MVKSTKIGQNFTFLAITFDDLVTQLQYKLHFRKALIITFRMIFNLSGFVEVRIFPLFLVVTSLFTALSMRIPKL